MTEENSPTVAGSPGYHLPSPEVVLGAVIRGALWGMLSAGIVGSIGIFAVLALLNLPTLLSEPGNLPDFLVLDVWFIIGLIFAAFGLPAGFIMGVLVGLVDGVTRLDLRSEGIPLLLWSPIGGLLGAISGALVMRGFELWLSSTSTADPEMGLVLGGLFGLFGGLFAGPTFGLLYSRRVDRLFGKLRHSDTQGPPF